MSKENLKALKKRFKKIFNKRSTVKIKCEDGWFDLLYELCEDIELAGVPKDFFVVSIKEKLAQLVFRTFNSSEKIDELITEAEQRSTTICEVCGVKAKLRTLASYYYALCNKHYQHAKREIERIEKELDN